LIQAGLVPRLREEVFLPVIIRIRYDETAPSVGRQMIEALATTLANSGTNDLAELCRAASNLWLLLHDPACGLVRPNGTAAMRPVFLFDQFEEIFTLGQRLRGVAEDFRETLASIVENRMPREVRALVENDDDLAERLSYHAHPAKVLLSLREDYLHLLERWRWQLPAIMDNRMELRPLSGSQALQAVIEPGSLRPNKPPIVSPEVGASIVRFVAGVQSDVPLDELDAVPPLLSLLCAELNAERLAAGDETIKVELLQGRSSHILEKFYANAFASHPPAVREFVENRLLSDAGYRQAVTLDTAEAELERAGVSKQDSVRVITDLVQRRLLVVEERGGIRRIELTHDVLTPVALASRTARREREEAERVAAVQRERFRRQRRIGIAVAALILCGCAALLFYTYQARQQLRYRDLLDSGYLALDTANYPEALHRFKDAARMKPGESSPWFGIGDTLVRQFYASGDSRDAPILSDAINAYNRALDIEKRHRRPNRSAKFGHSKLSEAYVGLGDVYAVGVGPDFEKAREMYTQAQEIDPESPKPPVGFGNILLGSGRIREAADQYQISLKAALKRNEPDYGAHAGLGTAYFNLGRYRLAIEEFNRAIGARPNAVVPLLQLANAIYLNDRTDHRASELLESLVGSDMKRLDCLARTNLAYMLFERANGSEDKAALSQGVRHLEEAYQKDRYAFSAFRLGIARALEGNKQEASNLWNEAATLSWGGDPLGRRIYEPLLAVARGDSAAFQQLQSIIEELQNEGAVGLLEAVMREATLIQRSNLYPQEINPVCDLLAQAIQKARSR
ncbi:MAG TPA: tetratricopeptide repeat protein, partial [Chthoniobacterales bacterium]|nr:tetratricopeptide repeat protein [Chthoniobacterales bacterium]